MKIVDLMCEHMPAAVQKGITEPYCIGVDRPHFSFCIDGEDKNIVIKYYKLIVASSLDLINDGVGDMYDSGLVYSSQTVDIEYNGAELLPRSVYYFRVYAMVGTRALKSAIGSFSTGIGSENRLKDHFISAPDGFLHVADVSKNAGGTPAPYFRRDVKIEKKVASAYAYTTALGVYEFYINGKKIGSDVLSPGFTDYHKTLQYRFHDVSAAFAKGVNTLGAVVGDGWYRSNLSFLGRELFGDKAAFSAYIYLIFDDGSYDEIFTDNCWECASGAYVYTDNQNGEYFDSRLERIGRFFPGHNDYGWVAAANCRPPFLSGTKLIPAVGPEVREMTELSPVSVTENGGKYIADMGQNMVGVLSLKLDCPAGTEIKVRHGEMLNDANEGQRGCDGPEGSLYTTNLRTARQTDTYICRGTDDEFRPRFTFHGFRYAEISGLPYEPKQSDISGHVLYSACRRTGEIETSDKMLNKLISNIEWGQRGNFLSLPTDCPQRDERLGWTGDAQVFCKSGCYGMDCAEFYKKYLNDVADAQKPNGSVTDIAPMIKSHGGNDLVGNGNAAWGDAIFVIPYTVYRMYGDKRIIENVLPYAEKYYAYLMTTTKDRIRPDAGYGDWLSVNEETPKDVLATAFLAYDAHLLSEMFTVVEDAKKAGFYKKEFELTSAAFREEFMHSGDLIKGDTQCCYLLALKFGLCGERSEKNVVSHLVRKIREANDHLRVGFVGISYLLPVLCDYGYADTAYKILLNTDYPSWGYSVVNGATTVWERWNSYTKENGFGDAGMNSFNHYSLGSCYEWMYEYMLGIKPLTAGFGKFIYKPYPDKRIGKVSGSYRSISGVIRSEWKRTAKGFDLMLTVPINTAAVIEPDDRMNLCTDRGYVRIKEKTELRSGVYCFKFFDHGGAT